MASEKVLLEVEDVLTKVESKLSFLNGYLDRAPGGNNISEAETGGFSFIVAEIIEDLEEAGRLVASVIRGSESG